MKTAQKRPKSMPRAKTQHLRRDASLALLSVLLLVGAARAAASPVTRAWPVSGSGHTVAVAAGLAGCYATGNALADQVEIRDIATHLRRTITRDEIKGLLPWFRLSGGPDGISRLAFTDSCRLLFIRVHDHTRPEAGEGSDVVLRYDTLDDTLSVFAQLNLFTRGNPWPYLTTVHYAGQLYVGRHADGMAVYQARANDTVGVLLSQQELPGGGAIRGLAVDRGSEPTYLYAATATTVFRATLGVLPLAFTQVGELETVDIQGITYARHYGAPGQEGLYLIAPGQVWHIPETQARGETPFAPRLYATGFGAHDIAATPDGALLLGARQGAVLLRDDDDPRLSFRDFLVDEFQQAVLFTKALISPDGEPPGWVIDANVPLGQRRFHPASPDAAAWAILILLLSDRIDHDMAAQDLVRTILVRYAGIADDGIVPERSEDGIYRHWYEPHSGAAKAGWDPEWAVLSTMKIVLAAARAQRYYPSDPTIEEATNRILLGVRNWDAYLTEAPACHVYLKGLEGGGPDLDPTSSAFNEASLFVEQAQSFSGSKKAITCFDAWRDGSRWPAAALVKGQPLTGDVPGVFLPAFPYLYAFLLQPDFRSHPDWQEQLKRLWGASAAWTDDHGPRFVTVFSAGTTKLAWTPSGYHVDTLGDHPGNVAHFPALLGFASQGDTSPAVAAYHAYRHGARQTFQPASGSAPALLYRRSNVDPVYTPNSAGLPDVLYGVLGLSALLDPGAIDDLLAIPYPALTALKASRSTVSQSPKSNTHPRQLSPS